MNSRMRPYLDAVAVIVVALDSRGRVLFVNRRGCELLGCREDRDIIGADWIGTFVPARHRARTRRVLRALWEGEQRWAASNVNEVVTRSGEERVVSWTNEVLRDEGGATWAVIGTGEDVTERRRAEDQLARIGRAVEAAHDGIGILGSDGRTLYMNPSLRGLTGYGPAALAAAGGPAVLYAEPGSGREVFLHTLREGSWRGEVELLSEDGALRTVLLRADAIRDESGRPIGLVAVHTDLTEQRRLEGEVLRAAEEERRRIGRDLHDGLGSHLTGLGLMVRSIARRAADQLPALAEEIEEVAQLLRDGADHAQTLARGLAPVGLERGGLRQALDRLVARADQAGSGRCTLRAPRALPQLPAQTAAELYRIAQEAVNNALRHAGATTISVSLRAEPDGANGGDARVLELTVRDDGRGFDPHLAPTGLGLRSMAHRARELGADLDVSRSASGGAVVRCRLLLPPDPPGG